MNSFNATEAIEYVNKIIANVRCSTCDKLEGRRVRYMCGHSGCEECDVCAWCSPTGEDNTPKHDQHWTYLVQHATKLLETCHKLFGPAAFQHKRISEQLKIEKEVFPKCIQAPLKYQNRRKSSKYSLDNKENRNSTIFDGETVLCKDNRMENSVTYVQQWLNRNEKSLSRKPFADLNVNTQRNNDTKNKNVTQNSLENVIQSKSVRKRSHFNYKTKNTSNITFTDECDVTSKKPKKKLCRIIPKNAKKELWYINDVPSRVVDNDESGIFMDNDPIAIEESQETRVDKDRQAWLAVLRAHRDDKGASSTHRPQSTTPSNKQTVSTTEDITGDKYSRVPFYRRSALSDSGSSAPHTGSLQPVVIRVDCGTRVTTITVHRDVPDGGNRSTRSVALQTEDTSARGNGVDILEVDDSSTRVHSEQLVSAVAALGGVLVPETDSEGEGEGEGAATVRVLADVHHTPPLMLL